MARTDERGWYAVGGRLIAPHGGGHRQAARRGANESNKNRRSSDRITRMMAISPGMSATRSRLAGDSCPFVSTTSKSTPVVAREQSNRSVARHAPRPGSLVSGQLAADDLLLNALTSR
uniref:Uncharacterized protein n=1 Tax=Plectus sambesii TaxID=2011161 RepID=A0A914XC16_9BILA